MAFTETLADFLDTTQGFAVNATLGAATVPVIFDNAFADVLGIVGGTQPEALCVAADVAGVAIGDSAVINSVTYAVVSIHPDGTGLTRLRLQES